MQYEIYPQSTDGLLRWTIRRTIEIKMSSMNCATRQPIFKVNVNNLVALVKHESIHDEFPDYTGHNCQKNIFRGAYGYVTHKYM